MFLDRETRTELNELSRVVFGSSSKWQKFVEKGVWIGQTKEVEEEIPGENGAEPTKQTKTVPVLGKDGKQQKVLKRYTLEEVKNMMLTYKKIREDFMENQRKIQAQQALQQKVQEKASGTAVS
jgi:hypothetical protein